MSEISKGTLIAGRYQIVKRLAVGGMGEIWHAQDKNLGIDVALKQVVLNPRATAAQRQSALAYARKEARHAVTLRSHPNIVAVHDVVDHDGMPWMVMDLVKGPSLAEVLRSGPVDVEMAARVATGVLAALKSAHKAGIIHRDVKPANIMIAEEGHVLLTDFGIAKHYEDTRITMTGLVVGTLEYMSPERFDDQLLPAGDLWSLGVTLYEATEGVSPFRRNSPMATVGAIGTFDPPQPVRAGRLAPMIAQMMNRSPGGRPSVVQAEAMLNAPTAPETEVAKVTGRPSTGTVKWFNSEKGYGFIAVDGGADVFVHYSNVEVPGFRELHEGQRVELVIVQSPKGPISEHVRPI